MAFVRQRSMGKGRKASCVNVRMIHVPSTTRANVRGPYRWNVWSSQRIALAEALDSTMGVPLQGYVVGCPRRRKLLRISKDRQIVGRRSSCTAPWTLAFMLWSRRSVPLVHCRVQGFIWTRFNLFDGPARPMNIPIKSIFFSC